MERLILLPVIIVCLVRTAGYGIYTFKDKNRTGAMGLFMLCTAAAMASVYFFMR